MTDLNLRAARIQLHALIAALLIAIIIAVGITIGAFVLSFAVQRDLAQQAGIPHWLAWIFPAIVDGAILGATIAVVALSKISGGAAGKKFFLSLAVVVVLISVFGNAYHAHQAGLRAARAVTAGIDLGYTPLSPTGASLIAIIPPLLVLAFTHGVGVLIKAIGSAYAEFNVLAQSLAFGGGDAMLVNNSDWVVAGDDRVEASVAAVGNVGDVDASAVAADCEVAKHAAATAMTEAHGEPGMRAAEPTTAQLLAFIEESSLDPLVKKTARIKITEPATTWGQLADATEAKAPSTALRRYNKAVAAAVNAGFAIPPLPAFDRHDDLTNTPVSRERNGSLISLRNRMVSAHC
ncbi:DUF2637 domain-containing protein [Rhodococcus sp. LB1]|uniref:DUF2637 domain-containing protein n=1 Tax=Rhodococcus sp. LB1 TaxID=1807499 RepID=UPI00077A1A07|nr:MULTISPECIES: DUF2637 domain-containing protein [Rhodococcus]KXX60892.1 excisionase [Rhodococcus sp. LB1]GLK40736.1 hypothetical protein GCM10017611_76110 [Rhodococcus wratislaviensis]